MRIQIDKLLEAAFEIEKNNEEITNRDFIEPEEEIEKGEIFERIKKEKSFEALTNFHESEILEIFYDFDRFLDKRKRGPKSKISPLDSFLILLIFYKTGLDFLRLASFLNIKHTSIPNIIKNGRKALILALRERWDPKNFQT